MAWTGSAPNQTYQRTDGVRTGAAVNVTAKANGVNDTAALADARENDFADALNLVLKRDGGNMPTADLPMDGHTLTGMGQGADRDESIRLDQVQDGDLTYAEASGTANAIALTTTPTCTPVEGMVIGFVAEADSTSTVTIDLNGAGALALQVGGSACIGGEINNGQFHQVGFDGTQWQLLNPSNYQPADSDLTAIAALSPSNDDILQRKSGAWANRTMAQLIADLAALGTTFQPLDSDLTAIAATSTVSYGRSLLTLANQAALQNEAGGVPSGTKSLFQQTSAPAGWTKDTTHNNKALRVVSGTASSGGSVAFTTAFASQTPSGTVGDTTLTLNQIPLHGHPWYDSADTPGTPNSTGGFIHCINLNSVKGPFTGTPNSTNQIGGAGGGQAHDHSFTGNAINLAVQYVDIIIAVKD